MNDNVARLPGGETPHDNNNKGPLGERVRALEERTNHLATKTDVSNLKIWILAGVIGAVPILVTLFFVAVRLLQLMPGK